MQLLQVAQASLPAEFHHMPPMDLRLRSTP